MPCQYHPSFGNTYILVRAILTFALNAHRSWSLFKELFFFLGKRQEMGLGQLTTTI